MRNLESIDLLLSLYRTIIIVFQLNLRSFCFISSISLIYFQIQFIQILEEPYRVNGVSRTWGEHIVELVNGPKNVDLLDNTCNTLKSILVRGQQSRSSKFMNSNVAECTNAYIEMNAHRMERLSHEIIANNENVMGFKGFNLPATQSANNLRNYAIDFAYVLTFNHRP